MNKRNWLALLLSLLATTITAAPMHDAARAGKLSQVKKLVSQGASVNAPDYYGFTPLLLAQLNGQNITAGWLESKGARDGLPPLTTTLQRYLQYLGFSIGSIDGVLGSDTRAAISTFQQQQKLPVNGRVREDWVRQLHNEVQSKIQRRLQTLGYYQGEIDGLMGPGTRTAIETFQKQAGLAADARISPQLLSKLQEDIPAATPATATASQPASVAVAAEPPESAAAAAPAAPATPAATPAAATPTAETSAAETSAAGPTATAGSVVTEQRLRHLQIRLQLLGYDPGTLDGQMGPATDAAIRKFQAAQKLPVTGEISADWIERLNEEVLRTLGFSNAADLSQTLPGPAPTAVATAITEPPPAPVPSATSPQPAAATPAVPAQTPEQTVATAPEAAAPPAPANAPEPPAQAVEPATVTSLTADDTTSIPQLFRWEGDLNNLSKRFINRLQTRLQVLGYATGEIDGVMGPSTVSAIRTFQEKNGLTVNGRVSESWLPQLESELIKHTQSRLVDAGFDPGPVDGAMGGRTVTAINAFQKQMSLPQNGSVSDTLVAKLEEAIAARIAAQQAQEAAQKAREAEQQALQEELKASQRAEQTQLQMIQANLQALGFYSDKVDGQLGPATRQAIGKFQRKVKLKADGQPGDKVLERTNSEIVRTVQARLQVLGYQPGPADGAMGTRTRDAIRDFEGRTGMPVSGEATPVLVAKIQQVIDARLAEQQTQKAAPQPSPPAQQPAKSAEPPAPATAAAAVASTAETAAIDETDESYETDEAAETAETAETTETAKKIILNSTTIAKLQADLDVLGYDPGPADGKMGDRTLNAIRQYQRSAGLGSSAEPSQLLLAKLSEDAAKAPKTSKKQNTAAKRSQGGNTEIQGALKFQRASSGALLGCSIKGVQLDRVWCDPFVARRNTSDCKVVLRPNSEVLLVKCS